MSANLWDVGDVHWARGWPNHPLYRDNWPPLPKGRRPRQLERWRRELEVRDAHRLLLAVLVQRVIAAYPPLRPEPIHGPRCQGHPGCSDCAAIERWRVEYVALSGAPLAVRRWLFP